MSELKEIERRLRKYRENKRMIKRLDIEIMDIQRKGFDPNKDINNNSDIIKKLVKAKNDLETDILRIESMLESLNDTEKKLIKHRFFEQLTFKEIASEMAMSDIYLIALKKTALKKMLKFENSLRELVNSI